MARKFIYDGREFEDPDPALSIDEVKNHLATFYGEVANATTQERTEGENTVIEFTRRVGTKGAGESAGG